jgi:hypothetical protein
MVLTRLSVSKEIEVSFGGERMVDKYTEAEVLLMRDGKDFEAKMKERQKYPNDHTFVLSRTPLGDLDVTVIRTKR